MKEIEKMISNNDHDLIKKVLEEPTYYTEVDDKGNYQTTWLERFL